MFRPALAVLLLLLLAGCSTPQGLREGAPAFAAQSGKPMPDVAGCIATAWSRFSGHSLNTVATPDRTTVSMGGGPGGTDIIADVYLDGRVEVQRRGGAWFGRDKALIADVQGCL